MSNIFFVSDYFFKLASGSQQVFDFARKDNLNEQSVLAPFDFPEGWNCPSCGKPVNYEDVDETSFYIYDIKEDQKINIISEESKNKIQNILNKIETKENFLKDSRIIGQIDNLLSKLKYSIINNIKTQT
jgi:hypothetical protein